MKHVFAKELQSCDNAAFRFGEFELHPGDRILQRSKKQIALQPKAFDALLCLVNRADRLVSKQELIATLWPTIHVTEANLTNTIGALRKVIGRDAIRTVSKYGYRFVLPVTGEPNVSRATYERFTRAKELTAQRSLESMRLARELYWTSLAEDPGFAAAWAWLGRCCYFLGKFDENSPASFDLADAALRRAFTLDPELAYAHQFYTFVQVDTGHADEAMCRLLSRLQRHHDEPESLANLVQVHRFQGLLQESLEAHKRALELDPAAVTSVAHTLFLAGEYAAAIEAYSGRGAFYLDAAAWAALGDSTRSTVLLRERLERMPLSKLMSALMGSLLAVLEDRPDDALRQMKQADTTLKLSS